MKFTLEFSDGIPNEEGWYLVRLTGCDRPYSVDYCTVKVNGGMRWINYFMYQVTGWVALPEA